MVKEVRKVINASGKMSILGTSVVSDRVASEMARGAQSFFVMKEYLRQLEASIAKMMDFESTKIVASAASGIVTATAAVIGRDDVRYALNPKSFKTHKREIILPKGHNVNFGASIETMVEFGGGVMVEAGYANECYPEHIAQKINENTAGILYIKSHHTVQKNMLSIEEAIHIAKQHDVPLIVDAAAEEDFSIYSQYDIDLLIFSGSKALEGPSSGIIAGNETTISWCKLVDQGLGRAMKVTKEMATGLHQAIVDRNITQEPMDLSEYVTQIEGATINQDSAGREIYRLAINTTPSKAKSLIKELESGNPAIFTRNYLQNQGTIEVDTRALSHEEMDIIIQKIKETLYE